MNKRKMISLRRLSVWIMHMVMYFGAVATGMASIISHSNDCHTPKGASVILTSNSFNAHKGSSFTIVGQMQEIERGLTLIHFNTPEKFEYATFDTYASEEAVDELIAIIQEMQKNNAVFAILAHDSAANGSMKQSDKLSKLGLLQLSTLKGRQAYIMHNFYGKIDETVDNLSTNLEVNLSEKLSDNHIYFPKIKYSYVPNIDRYIAHGGGEVNGIKSTNSKEALDESYRKGFRLFEMDITETSDGKWVASHDWNMWARFTDYEGSLPPSYSEFMKHKIYGDYTTLDLKAINEWFRAHPDATLVTDKVNDPIAFANAFVDKSRLIMELFSLMSVEEASKNGINAMISQDPLLNIVGDKINYLEVNKVKFVSLSRKIIANQAKLMLQLRDHGIKVYVYNVNFDPGKDEKYVEENEFGLIYGMYADKWVFDNKALLSN